VRKQYNDSSWPRNSQFITFSINHNQSKYSKLASDEQLHTLRRYNSTFPLITFSMTRNLSQYSCRSEQICSTHVKLCGPNQASIRSRPVVVQLNCEKVKGNQNKYADPPDNASLYRFMLQRKFPDPSEALVTNTYFSLLSYHIRRNDHFVTLRKGSSHFLPVWSK
jgi:hypothetical protein